MRHAVFHGDEKISIVDGPDPQAAAGEVRLRVRHTALCGSDNRLWREGARNIPGHEVFGVVDQVGHSRHGERACAYIAQFCGRCRSCKGGLTQSCDSQSSLLGWNRDGGFAEYIVLPEHCLLPVPDSIEDRLAPLLLDTIGTSAHAVRTVGRLQAPDADARVLICGAGPLGIGVLIALQDAGYQNIEVSEPQASRLDFARQLGARTLSQRDGQGFSAVFECSGAHAARDYSIENIAPGGAIVLIGENSAPWAVQEGPVMRRKDFYMLRSFYFPLAEHVANIDLLLRQRKTYTRLIDSAFDLDSLPVIYPRFVAGEFLKPLLTIEPR